MVAQNLQFLFFNREAFYSILHFSDAPVKCQTCRYNEVTTSNKALQWVIDGISLVSSDACLLDEDGDSADDDKYNVNIRNCVPPTKAGYINKCYRVDGSVTFSLLGEF